MYSRKVPQSLLQSQPNLKCVILKNKFTNAKSYFFKYSLMINKLTLTDACKGACDVKSKMRTLLETTRMFKTSITAVPRSDQSANLLKVWAHQCECVAAQRLRRGQQMFCLYSRLWEEKALKDMIKRMRQQLTKNGKAILFSAVSVSVYNWDNNRISDDELRRHMNEFEYITVLREKTVLCPECGQEETKGRVLKYCECPGIKTTKRTYDDWTLFIECSDMIIWRKLHKSGSYEYKVYGSFDDVTAEDFLNVQVDTKYRKTWDTTAVALEVIEKDPQTSSNSDVVYWEMLWPKLFVNRDYVFNRRFMVDCRNKMIMLVSRGTDHATRPVTTDKHRVQDYWSYMVIKPHLELDKTGIEFSLTYYDNPGINIPSAVTTWVAMRAMPDFLCRLRAASKQYQSYCKKEKNECVCSIARIEEFQRGERQKKEDADSKRDRGCSGNKSVTNFDSPGIDIMTSPIVQHELDSFTYWNYLHPNYYFS